jgi:hypothetical protein
MGRQAKLVKRYNVSLVMRSRRFDSATWLQSESEKSRQRLKLSALFFCLIASYVLHGWQGPSVDHAIGKALVIDAGKRGICGRGFSRLFLDSR